MLSEYSEEVRILYHGGEPTLTGKEWYRRACELAYKYYNSDFQFNIQTNGVTTVKDSEWLQVFEDYNSIVGFSFDISSQNVRTPHLSNYTEKLIDRINALGSTTVDTGIISVVSRENVGNLIQDYKFMKERVGDRLACMTFAICTESRLNHHDYSVEPSRDYKALADFRKYLLTDKDGLMETFTMDYVRGLLIPTTLACCFLSNCNHLTMGINPDGEFLYCDSLFYEHRLPNIDEVDSIREVMESEAYQGIESDMAYRIKNKCESCSYFELCNGYCLIEHYSYTGDLKVCSDKVCDFVKLQYNSTYDALQNITKGTVTNDMFTNIVLNYLTFLPKEIEYFLSKLGIKINIHIEMDEKTDLPSTWQYKLFKLFVDSKRIDSYYFFSEERFKLFKEVYEINRLEVDKLIGGNYE